MKETIKIVKFYLDQKALFGCDRVEFMMNEYENNN